LAENRPKANQPPRHQNTKVIVRLRSKIRRGERHQKSKNKKIHHACLPAGREDAEVSENEMACLWFTFFSNSKIPQFENSAIPM
jgi:hypothetical protein